MIILAQKNCENNRFFEISNLSYALSIFLS